MAEAPFVVVPKPLRERLGDEATEALVSLLNHLGVQREEIRALRTDVRDVIGAFRMEMHDAIAALRTDTQESISALRGEMHDAIAALRTEMYKALGALRTETHDAIAGLRTEMQQADAALERRVIQETGVLRIEIARTYASLVKWMFIFWIGQLGAILAILKVVGAL